jgi:hypothetical protein
MYDQDGNSGDDLQAIANILAAGYLRFRERQLREKLLAVSGEQSVHGHEVNEPEEGESGADEDTAGA